MRIVFLIWLILLGFSARSANLDSLTQEYRQTTTDSVKFKLLSSIISSYLNVDAAQAERYALEQCRLAIDQRQKATAWLHLGLTLDYQYQFDSAIVYYHRSKNLFSSLRDSVMLSRAMLNLGIVNYYKGDPDSAIYYYIHCLEMSEKIGHTELTSSALSNLGALHRDLKDYAMALKYNQRSLALDLERSDTVGIAISYNNIAMAYKGLEQYDKAFDYYTKCLRLRERIKDTRGMATVLTNIGQLYFTLGNFTQALEYNLKSLEYEELNQNQLGIIESYVNIGDCYAELQQLDKAVDYLTKALAGAKKLTATEVLLQALEGLSSVMAQKGDYPLAYAYKSRYTELKDSLFEISHLQEVREIEAKYQTEQMEKENELLKQKNTINELKIGQKEQLERNLYVGLALLLIILVLVVYAYRSNLSSNKKLALRNHRIGIMNSELQLKNKSITDSIVYAKRIQQAILPQDHLVKSYLPDSFILYKPKDIVSGDFYWMEKVGDEVLFAAVDCTGHGVPGAFMSIVGNNGLNKAVKEKGNRKPALILDLLHEHVVSAVQHNSAGGIQDGMDIAFCNLNTTTRSLQFAGANNPLYVIRNGDVIVFEADKQAIGDVRRPFTHHHCTLQPGDMIYAFTDGYADQFGGDKSKKFNSKRFKETLLEIHTLPPDYQKEQLERILEEWQGNEEQLDDICIIGVKV